MAGERISVVSPEGQVGTIPAQNWEAAKARGFKLAEQPKTLDQQASGAVDSAMKAVTNAVGSETLADAATGVSSLYAMADPVVAGAGALGSYLVPYTSKPGASFIERYQNEMEGLRRRRGEALQRSPTATTSGAVVPAMTGAIPIPTPLSSAAGAVPGAAGALARTAAGVGDAALYTGLTNAGANADKGYLDHFIEGATSPLNLIGAAPGAVELAKIGASRAPGIAKMAPEAVRLEGQGVKTTLGQALGRDHWYNKLEQTLESLPIVGPRIAAKRAVPASQVERAAQGLATPPGAARPSASASGGIEQLEAAFETAYSQVHGWPMAPVNGRPGARGTVPLDRAFANAAKRKDAGIIPDSVRNTVGGWLRDQLTALKPDKAGMVDSSQLLSLRNRIRAEKRASEAAMTSDPSARASASILDTAEAQVTAALEGQLPSKLTKQLRETDRAYANFATLRKAQSMANSAVATVNETPTVAHMLRAGNAGASEGVKAGTPDFPIQQLFRDAAGVIPNTTPTTGARAVTTAPLVLAGGALGGATGAALLPAALGAGVNWAATSPLARSLVFGGKGGAVAPMSLAKTPFMEGIVAGNARNPVPGFQTPALKWQGHPAYAQAVPSPRELAQADPVVGEAYQKGGPQAAAATFYSEAQKRPDQLLHWLNDPQP